MFYVEKLLRLIDIQEQQKLLLREMNNVNRQLIEILNGEIEEKDRVIRELSAENEQLKSERTTGAIL